ncbi:unnamed protein product [Pocillopora meandrina]|uniref:Dynamin-type G domain-containing protein n=1 Tax=Pocillopora meandrina TaxID=46732 RepID=A0AAU9XJF2_9CNID|nr:unnamed protein product [Pocillopora meandrina]
MCLEYFINILNGLSDKNDIKKDSSEVSGFLAQVSSISEILRRNQIKVAFFGRTSNGKSTTINAMLQDKILPMGMGHTTNCFLSVHGLDTPDPYILVPGSDDKKNVKSLCQLAHALSEEKLDPSSLVQVFWPKSSCKMFSEDVVLVDSPGIDVSNDLNEWIDKHCLDADVFVLVANAESTLTEKSFFHKVNQRFSRPNIFILYNRWDASASEPDTMKLVKDQHLSRSISFLADELKCVDKGQAEQSVFLSQLKRSVFLSQHIQTKFESHALSGLKIANMVEVRMQKIVDSASQQRSKLEKTKMEEKNRLEYVKEQLISCKHDFKCRIEEITSEVEVQVKAAMTEEIDGLALLVNEFDPPFLTDTASLKTYKEELCNHLKSCLERNMTDHCSNFKTQVICGAQEEMKDRLRSLLPPETPEVSYELSTPVLDFQANYPLAVSRLLTGFHEDIKFHFSLDWRAISGNLGCIPTLLAIALGVNILGWKFIALCGVLFTLMYTWQWVLWTCSGKKEAFKRQFVDHTSKQLRVVVSLISDGCSKRVKRELTSTIATLESLVQREMENLEENIIKLDQEITRLEKIKNHARILGTKQVGWKANCPNSSPSLVWKRARFEMMTS